MQDIFEYIDQHADEYIDQLKGLCAQPSVAAQDLGMTETAEMVLDMLGAVGAEARLVPSAGYPVAFGQITGDRSKVLSFYDHYDVQPPEPLEAWDTPPFEPTVRDGRLFARGVSDNKGNLVARLAAVDAYQKVRGRLPLTIKFLVEGEEEIGSPNMEAFAETYQDLIAADGCIWEAGYKDTQGRPSVYLGVKGICYVGLRVTAANVDLHSSWATIVPNAAWRLIWALESLKGSDEQIRIPGLYDDVQPPTEAELEALRRMPFDAEERKGRLGLPAYLNNLEGEALLVRHIFQPTCTVCGIGSGYQGTGLKTVLPHEAAAKLDMRLVVNQDPHDIYTKLRRHLDEHGFMDVETELLAAEHPAKTPLDDPLAQVVIEAAQQVYARDPVVYPSTAGTGPMYVLCQRWGIPAVSIGVGNADSRNHAPNENIILADFIEGIKHVIAIIERFGQV